nr:spermatogenesis-associated protein 20 isoform X3 [Chrysemys picta bellii]
MLIPLISVYSTCLSSLGPSFAVNLPCHSRLSLLSLLCLPHSPPRNSLPDLLHPVSIFSSTFMSYFRSYSIHKAHPVLGLLQNDGKRVRKDEPHKKCGTQETRLTELLVTVFLRGGPAMATGGKSSRSSIHRYTNRLINEKSPYLLQHAHNPVDWYPWGQEAFDKAKKENKLIFLSVGYSTCHWCHVMEQESFKNKEIGKILNDNFVCIKVDREERPDVDKVYMTFVQATSSGGGWPMSVWLTPDLKPFIGGTYFPPEDGIYQVGFRTVLLRIADQGFHRYSTDQRWHVPHFEKMLYDQGQLAVAYARAFQISGDEFFADVAADVLLYVSRDLSDRAGGFYSAEDADSYPTAKSKEKREGAFCVWTAEEIRRLLPEPVEGASERKTLADVFMHHYGVKEGGNVSPAKDPHKELRGQNVLIVQYSLELTAARFGLGLEQLKTMLAKSRERLCKARGHRPRPHLDTKMLASWNGLMISGFAQSGAILGKEEYISRAGRAADFLRSHLFDASSGRLLRSCYRGKGSSVEQSAVPIQGFLEDYVFVIQALFDLYEASLNQSWLEWALQLQRKQDELFWDSKGFAYFSSEAGDSSLLLRLKDDQDGVEPSTNSVAVANLLRAACYSGNMEWVKKAGQILAAFSERLLKIPVALPEMARATVAFHRTLKQVVICGAPEGEDTKDLLRCVHSVFAPNKVLMLADGDSTGFLYHHLPFLSSLERKDGKATAYLCENFACSLPVTSSQELRRLLLL